ncbi:pyridoxamine 5'-phosphate oxidase [Phytoactinopolyspora endophytica]|uniref:pyridoxamine 5'-phosphate oxidase n=1 Tax=Phytoactinopolyspora endophytica TaxID=1642495 RepID=UPI0023EA55B7|nr:pyridoxamine 5'-phosphate oxidase [Phytoactinopolyspora endophytica]
MKNTLALMRRRYTSTRLLESDAAADPFTQFRSWLHDSVTAGLPEPNAMVLATATRDGVPSSRHVLLKELDDEGFVFFTNHGSRKASELSDNPHASLCFPWFPMERQVVACGTAAAISREESQAYWVTRPRDSQIGAWASQQSTVIGSREELESEAAAMAKRFPEEVPLPDFWGGFRLVPDTVEFWQGGLGRLHDRLRYRRAGEAWVLERLAP